MPGVTGAAPASPEGRRRHRRDLAILAVAVVLLAAALAYLANLAPSEVPTIEQLVPPARAAEVRRLRAYFGADSDLILVAVTSSAGPPSAADLGRLEARIAAVSGVTQVFSAATRPRLALEGGDASDPRVILARGLPEGRAPTPLDRFLRPAADTALLVVTWESRGATLTVARRILRDLRADLDRARAPDQTIRVVGFPAQRVTTWEEARRDVRRTLPLLVAVALVVPWLFFRSAWAALFPLIMAGLASAGTVLLYRLVVGALHPWVLVLIPLVWSVATMDTLHLWECSSRLRDAGHPEPVAGATRELAVPCLVTALVTAASLLAMAVPGGPPLMRVFGVWGAVGTALAYLLSFVVTGPLLRLARARGRTPEAPSRLARKMIAVAQRHAAPTVAIWALLVALSAAGLARLGTESSYTDAFVPDHPFARDLAVVRQATGSDLVPIEIYVEAPPPPPGSTTRAPAPTVDVRGLLLATAALDQYLHTLPETQLALSVATLGTELLAVDPRARAWAQRPDDPADVQRRVVGVAADPRLGPWIDLHHGATRTVLLLRPATFARRAEILAWIDHFGRTVLGRTHVDFGGVGYLYHAAETEARAGIAWSLGGDLVLLVAALAIALARPRAVVAGLLGNVAPVVVLGGLMAAAGVSWSLGLLGLPVIVLGLAADDTIHLLWPLRRRHTPIAAGLARAYRRFGSAAIATSVLVAASLSAIARSGFRSSRSLGWLLPAGIMAALVAEVTLVPALLALRRRRAPATDTRRAAASS